MSLTLVSAVAVAAPAQRVIVRDSARAERDPGRIFTYQFGPDAMSINMRRGRLGITVDLRPDAARDSIGARVSGVTPGGPADRAGVQTGDIITRLNGTRVAPADNRENDEEDGQSRPGIRLINLASRLEAGDTVRLDVRRGTQPMTLTFVADRTEMDQLVERMRVPGPSSGGFMMEPRGRMPFMMNEPRGQMHVMISSNLGDIELVKVTPQLAEGLGISEGVLVVSVDTASTLGLRAGDVITSIGGRRPTDPAHAMRILSSYDSGEAVAFEVMRQHRRATVNGRIPEARMNEWRVRPNNFEFSLPRTAEPMMRMLEQDLPRLMQMPKMMRFEGKV